MKSIFRIKWFAFCLLLIICFAGCSDDIEIETGNDPIVEAEKFADLSEPSLSGMFDDSEKITVGEESPVIVRKQSTDESSEKMAVDMSASEVEENNVPVDIESENVHESKKTDSESAVPLIPTEENTPIVDNAAVPNEDREESVEDVNNEVEHNGSESAYKNGEGSGNRDGGSEITSEKNRGNSESAAYILNNNTKKFHYPSCGSAKQIKEKNKGSGNDRNTIIAQGFTPCKRCNP